MESQNEAELQRVEAIQNKEMAKFLCEDFDELKLRLKKDTNRILFSPLAGVAGVIGMGTLCFCGHWFIGLIVLGICLIVMAAVAASGFHHRARTVKYSMVYKVLKSYFEPKVYLAYCRVPEAILNEADIIEDWDKATGSDYFWGTWKENKFQFADVSAYVRSSGIKKPERVFSGQLFVLETGLGLQTGISIHERVEPISAEIYAGMKNSERFFLTGNEQFDRQFDVHLGNCRNVSGFEQEQAGLSPEDQRKRAHEIVDPMVQDILDADKYAVSHTRMRFIGNRLYLAIENSRDTFELRKGDMENLEELNKRLDEEVRDMTLYLDLMTRKLEQLRKEAK